jgi:hypothetical protein
MNIPRTDADYDVTQKLVVDTSTANTESWKLNAEWMTGVLTPKRELWEDKYGSYKDPTTRTKVITAAKNNARKAYEPLLRQLVSMLLSNPLVTDDDLTAMGLSRGNGRTPVPVPSTVPVPTIDRNTVRRVTIYFRDENSGKRGKPSGVSGAVVRWSIADTRPTDVNDLGNSTLDTKSPISVNFAEAQRGKTMWFAMCWQNAKGQMGPFSEIQSAIVP